jgi:GxxExxY protein
VGFHEGSPRRTQKPPRHAEMELTNDEINDRTGQIVDAAMKVHTFLGPGLLESSYEMCLAHELVSRGLQVTTQYPIRLEYGQLCVEVAYRADMLIDNAIIVELKAVEKLAPIHEAQLLSYLKLTGFRVGLLINFHELKLKDGIRRRVNNF